MPDSDVYFIIDFLNMRSIFSLFAAQQVCPSRAALRARFAVREAWPASVRAASASATAPAAVSWADIAAALTDSMSARRAATSSLLAHPAPRVTSAAIPAAAVHLVFLLFTRGAPLVLGSKRRRSSGFIRLPIPFFGGAYTTIVHAR